MPDETILLQIPATIESISSRVDGTWSLKVGTQELDEESAKAVLALNRRLGYFIFKESAIREADLVDIPESSPEFKGDKTPSQRLRGVLYVLWEQTKATKTFDEFYRMKMESIITWVKEKLDK
jgi:hypothetical protein